LRVTELSCCCEYGTFRFGVRFGPNWVHNIGPPPEPGTGLPVQFGRYAEPWTGLRSSSERFCRELTTLWVARLDDGAELKVTDPEEQQGDVKEEETEGEERRDKVD